jgi:TonB family protein
MKTVLTAAMFCSTMLCAITLVASEDPKLRQEANELADRAIAVSRPARWAPYHSEAHFHHTSSDGSSTEGTYVIDYQAPNTRRREVSVGDFHALMIITPSGAGATETQPLLPPAAREVERIFPLYSIRFDKEDVIHDVRNSTFMGKPTRCIYFQSNFGSQTREGEACFDTAMGTLVHFRFGGQTIDSTNWTKFAGYWLPGHIEESEDGRLSMTIDQSFTAVDSFPPETFVIPPGATPFARCETFKGATGVSMPQPESGPGDNVDDIVVQGQIERDGTVTNAAILRSKRPDLNAEALQLIAQWRFRPTRCNGEVTRSRGTFTLHFKGR